MPKSPSRRTLLLWFALIVSTIAGLTQIEFGASQTASSNFIVITRHYGINASEIERSITDPLENQISELPGIKRLSSTSEFSQSRVTITLNRAVDADAFYLQLRDRVERAYAGWPDSVQRPQIHSSSSRGDPIFIAAFFAAPDSKDEKGLPRLRTKIEKNVKPAVEQLKGVGEVSISGGGIREIHVELIPERSARIGFTPGAVGGYLQGQHLRLPVGELEESSMDLSLILDGHLGNLEAMEELQLDGKEQGQIPLKSIASVRYGYREPEDISRLSGRETVTLYVKAAGGANLVAASRLLRREIKSLEQSGYSIEIVYDLGAELEKSIRQVLLAVFIGISSIAIFLAFALPSFRAIVHLILLLPLSGAFTLSLLTLFGIPIDQAILAGLAVGTGLMIDSALVVTEALYSGNYRFGQTVMPLAASTATTLIVFVPLTRAMSLSPLVLSISLALILLLTFALFYSVSFLPPFLRHSRPRRQRRTGSKGHFLLIFTLWCIHHPRRIIALFSLITAASLVTALLLPRHFGTPQDPGALFARLEMESGASLPSVDRRASAIVRALSAAQPDIISVESRAKAGQALLTIRFNEKKISAAHLADSLEAAAAAVPGVFAYAPTVEDEGAGVEFTLSGGDNLQLRQLAMDISAQAGNLPWVSGGVLHFKENPPAYVFEPDIQELRRLNLDIRDIAGLLKWSIQGPVALKWFQNGEERDLRVFMNREKVSALPQLHSLSINTAENERAALGQIGQWRHLEEPSRITHANRQRAVSFTLLTNTSNLNKLLTYSADFVRATSLPPGYSLLSDEALEEKRTEYRGLWLSLAAAFLLIYAVLAVQSESLKAPLLELSIVPVSLAIPILCYAILGRPLKTSTLFGLILLAGMAVNNAILIHSRLAGAGTGIPLPERILSAVRARYRGLILTTGTTLLGALPLLLRTGSPFTEDMAFVITLGLSSSFLAALTFFPALLALGKEMPGRNVRMLKEGGEKH
ncbi:MAG: hypothetical protein B0D92_02030 [Spirochaeta sp. LUC14_002_19_P3]|nr:MAG: hypothetical protein B0D92_02030 [Spirochaeta sp. LUC14_002_19_P3]